MLSTFFLTMALQSHAGWCSRLFENFVAPDPNQYEQMWTQDLLPIYERYGQKGFFGKLTPDEAIQMNIAGGELRFRIGPVMRQFETQEHLVLIEQYLDRWSEHEGSAPYAKGRQ